MAIKTIQTVATSPDIAAMFAICDAANAEADRHEREVLQSPALQIASAEERHAQVAANNVLNDAWVSTMYAVCHHPVETAQDLRTKLAFMVEFEMGDGQDWLPTILEDAERIAGPASSTWDEALARVEKEAANALEALKAFNAIEAIWCADQTEDPVKSQAWDDAWKAYCEESTRHTGELRKLILMVPAPNAAAAMIKAQILLDSGLHGDDALAEHLAADLRRFSNYANREA